MTKKQKIEHIAKELFFKHGFKKVTIDEICKKAHVSRKTYYTFYENKIALVLFIIDEISSDTIRKFTSVINGEGTFAEKLEHSLQLKYEFSKMITMEFLADFFDPGAAEILEYWQKMMQESLKLLMDFFREGQRTGEMNPDINLNYVMWYFQKLSEILKSPEISAMFSNPEEMVKQVSKTMIYGIMPIKANN
jgi:AcrR family transcriptional regulator